MNHRWIAIGALMGLLAVIAGTFAAHGLDQRLSPDMLKVFETGVRYHMYHALAILVAALIGGDASKRLPSIAAGCFLMGIVFFSGSLYLLAITGAKWLGMITPVGGVSFLAGWGVLATTGMTRRPCSK